MSEDLREPCPWARCGRMMRVPAEMIRRLPVPIWCGCGRQLLAVVADETGAPTLARITNGTLRKGDTVLLHHTYQGNHGTAGGEWYTTDVVSRGGKAPRDSCGAPLDLRSVVGRVEVAS